MKGLTIGVDEQGRLPLPWLGDALARALALERSHALLAHGPAGAGHLAFGLLLAQAWLCEAAGDVKPCGRCASCHLVRTRVHPDLLLLLPEATRHGLGWAAEEEGAGKSDAKPSRELRVEQVRQAIAWSQTTSGRGRGKALLLHPADALNTASANALLKTLEEPPGDLRIVLTSADPERLLPTVRSRCQRVRLNLPDAAAGAAWLTAQGLADATALMALAGGSPLEALALGAEGIDADFIAALPRRIAAGDAGALASRPLPRVIDLLLKLAHDALAQAAGAAPRFFAAEHLPGGADLAALVGWQRALLRAARFDEHPWNAPLLLQSLVTQASAAWPKRGPAARQASGPSLHSTR